MVSFQKIPTREEREASRLRHDVQWLQAEVDRLTKELACKKCDRCKELELVILELTHE